MGHDGARGADNKIDIHVGPGRMIYLFIFFLILVQNLSSVLLYLKCWFNDSMYNFYVYNIVHVHISLIFGHKLHAGSWTSNF